MDDGRFAAIKKDLARSGKGLACKDMADMAKYADGTGICSSIRIDDTVIAVSAAKATPLWREPAIARRRHIKSQEFPGDKPQSMFRFQPATPCVIVNRNVQH